MLMQEAAGMAHACQGSTVLELYDKHGFSLKVLYLADPVQLGHILVSLALKLILDGASRSGQLEGELHSPHTGVYHQALHKAAGDDVLAKVGVNNAGQLPQDLFLACFWRHLHANSRIVNILLLKWARQ